MGAELPRTGAEQHLGRLGDRRRRLGVLIVTQYFPDTPPDTVAQLHEMLESVSFTPED